jgi:uncharacterized protein YjbI with pentapeptide repeats
MANGEHVALLIQGVEVWNKWREAEPNIRPDLSRANLKEADVPGADLRGADLFRAKLYRADLRGVNLSEADLRWAALREANLREADLSRADLRKADLTKADLRKADLFRATLIGADLSEADLSEALLWKVALSSANLRGVALRGAALSGVDLSEADLTKADLTKADLMHAILVKTNLTNANLTGCRVYGISAWDVNLERAKQENLIITDHHQAEITVDNIEVAQFIYLLLHNEKIRDVIDTIGKKGVLLLGRFTGNRMAILERLREELRRRDFVPIVFNFERPEKSDFTETVRTLAGLCRFIIADITEPRSTPLELQAVVPEYMVPFVPIIEGGKEPFAMFRDLWVKHSAWVLEPITYVSVDELVQGLDDWIIDPALARFDELLVRKATEMPVRSMGDLISGAKPSIS